MTRLELGCYLVGLVGFAITGVRWSQHRPMAPPLAILDQQLPAVTVREADSVTALANRIANANPFRFERRPSAVAYKPELEGAPAPPPVPRPQLRLVGTMGGPPWQGILEGVPGREAGVFVRAGDVLWNGALRVRSITRDTVVVVGRDTTWTLGVKRP